MTPPCEVIAPGIIACSRGPRRRLCSVPRCGQVAPLLCDGPKPGGGTCDAPICKAHALHVGHNRDLCPSCAAKRGGEPKP